MIVAVRIGWLWLCQSRFHEDCPYCLRKGCGLLPGGNCRGIFNLLRGFVCRTVAEKLPVERCEIGGEQNCSNRQDARKKQHEAMPFVEVGAPIPFIDAVGQNAEASFVSAQ